MRHSRRSAGSRLRWATQASRKETLISRRERPRAYLLKGQVLYRQLRSGLRFRLELLLSRAGLS